MAAPRLSVTSAVMHANVPEVSVLVCGNGSSATDAALAMRRLWPVEVSSRDCHIDLLAVPGARVVGLGRA